MKVALTPLWPLEGRGLLLESSVSPETEEGAVVAAGEVTGVGSTCAMMTSTRSMSATYVMVCRGWSMRSNYTYIHTYIHTSDVLEHKGRASLCTNETLQ